jgi:hypothetical protein
MFTPWRSRITVAILGGIGLLLGVGWEPAVPALRPTEALSAVAPPVLEQGVFARILRGQIVGKEAFTLLQQEEGFTLITNAKFQSSESDFEQRLATSLALTPEYVPQTYTLVQIVEHQDGSLELMGGQLTFSEGRARAALRWTLPEPIERDRAWELPSHPLVVLQPNVMSQLALLTRIFLSSEGKEATVAFLHPFIEEVDTARLRQLGPATIVFNDQEGQEQEESAERLELTLEQTGEVLELFLQNGEFIGAVAAGFGEDRPFILRWDLFPEGFRVKR